MRNGSFTNGYFSLGDKGEMDTNILFKYSGELAKFIDKRIDKYDDHPGIFHTGSIYKYFCNFNGVARSQHGRVANEFNNVLEHDVENCYIPNGNGFLLKFINYIFKKDFSMEYFETIQS